ncbi:MAG: EutN/CcmL family microcompartment protein [Lachnospiraceae bacterium]|nr:EutN/CcmL family microcompartment protein [Lachnospiraceae bacterium]
MYIAKVVGNVVATRKEESLVGTRFMIIQQVDKHENPIGNEVVAADYIGAGKGEIVLVGTGSSVRVGDVNKGKPIDAAILGIIDEIQ